MVEIFRIENVTFTTNTSFILDADPIDCILPQEHWKFSVAITMGSFAAFLSYAFITCLVLMPVACCPRSCCCTLHKKAFKDGTLSPFDDDNDDAKLSCMETCGFYFNYAFMHILFLGSFISSVIYADSVYNQDYCSINALNFARIVLHLSSQFCAIQSCFIFSKVVYKVTKKLEKLANDMDQVNVKINADNCNSGDEELNGLLVSNDNGKIDSGRYYWLQKIDQNYIDQVKSTLDLFGIWFVFHWIMYALTTILLSAVIVQVVIDIVGYNLRSINNLIPDTDAEIKASYVLYVVFFTLVHAYLFLYPCFRAAAIADARTKMINNISRKRWTYVPPLMQSNFIQYLTSQNFAFRVPFLFGNISFGFNWVYVSFFIAICGGYLKF